MPESWERYIRDREIAEQPSKTVFRVNWDNGNDACGTFPWDFATFEAADAFGKDWALQNDCDAGIDPGKVLELELPLDQAADFRTDRGRSALATPALHPDRRSWGRRPLRKLFGPAVGGEPKQVRRPVGMQRNAGLVASSAVAAGPAPSTRRR